MDNNYHALSRFQLDQNSRLPIRRELAGKFLLTYGFARSKMYAQATPAFPGDDYLEFWYYNDCIVFSVCDGVSQSFRGTLAASFLGHKLVDWLKNNFTLGTPILQADLEQALDSWVTEATKLVGEQEPRGPGVDEDRFKESKKKGSQTMFVVGVINYKVDHFFLAWAGDIRFQIQFVGKKEHYLPQLNSNHRWSSRTGLIKSTPGGVEGNLETFSGKAHTIQRLTVYTDGLLEFIGKQYKQDEISWLNDSLSTWLNVTDPEDDVTVLDIQLNRNDWQNYYGITQQPNLTKLEESRLGSNEWMRVFLKGDLCGVLEIQDLYSLDYKTRQQIETSAPWVQIVSAHALPSYLPVPLPRESIIEEVSKGSTTSAQAEIVDSSKNEPERTTTNQVSIQPLPSNTSSGSRITRNIALKGVALIASLSILIILFITVILRLDTESASLPTPTLKNEGMIQDVASTEPTTLPMFETVIPSSYPPTPTLPFSTLSFSTHTSFPSSTVLPITPSQSSVSPGNGATDIPTENSVLYPSIGFSTSTPERTSLPEESQSPELTVTLGQTNTTEPTPEPSITPIPTVIPVSPSGPFILSRCESFTVTSNGVNFYMQPQLVAAIIHVARNEAMLIWNVTENERVGNEEWVLLWDQEAAIRGWVQTYDLEHLTQCNENPSLEN